MNQPILDQHDLHLIGDDVFHNGCDALHVDATSHPPQACCEGGGRTAVLYGCTFTSQKEAETRTRVADLLEAGYDRVVLSGCAAKLDGFHTDRVSVVKPSLFQGHVRPMAGPLISVGQGCQGRCSYCSIRTVRGRLNSRSQSDIIADALLAAGRYSTVRLVGQEVAGYGVDSGSSMHTLLCALLDALPETKIEIGSLNPAWLVDLPEKQLELLAHPRISSNIHLALQSMSTPVLEAMRRGYTAEQAASLVRKLRDVGVSRLSIDLIIGFPTESLDDHLRTQEYLASQSFAFAQIFMFEPRPGTAAATWRQLPLEVTRSRTAEVIAVYLAASGALNRPAHEWVQERTIPFNTNLLLAAPDHGGIAEQLVTALMRHGSVNAETARSIVASLSAAQHIRAVTESPDPDAIAINSEY
jgi:tRNA A37 methylthiotransferase MiaB